MTLVAPLGCHTDISSTSLSTAELTDCAAAEIFGGYPDDAIDDRLAIQQGLNTGCVKLGPGTYNITTPAVPRSTAVINMPAGSRLEGAGLQTYLNFSGDPMGRDWRGIQLGSNTKIRGMVISGAGLTGLTGEQTHVMRADGPVSGIEIDHITIDHPVVPGTKRGDCIQFVGYPPTETSPDKRIRDVQVHHVNFVRCARSAIQVHSGLHDFSFTENIFSGTSDQDLDFEGTGDIVNGEIADNTFTIPAYGESALAVSIVASEKIHFHHNRLEGRGMDIYGCHGCEFDHNSVIQTLPNVMAAVTLRKASHTVLFHDEKYERAAVAGPGHVLSVMHKTSAPDNVSIQDSTFTQRSDGLMIYGWGIVGLSITHNKLVYAGTNQNAIGIVINGSAGDSGIRSTDLVVSNNLLEGSLLWLLSISGSYQGVGTLSMVNNLAASAKGGLSCSNVTTQGTITGPIVYNQNVAGLIQATCLPLILNQ